METRVKKTGFLDNHGHNILGQEGQIAKFKK